MTIGSSGSKAMSHAEFRVFVCPLPLPRHSQNREPDPYHDYQMTGMTPNNISRATRALQDKGWLAIHYEADDKRRKVINYELKLASGDSRLPLPRPLLIPLFRAIPVLRNSTTTRRTRTKQTMKTTIAVTSQP